MNNTCYTMQYLDEIYTNLTALGQKERNGEKPSAFLVRHKITGKIAVKKYVDADRIAVYEKLSRIEDPHLEKYTSMRPMKGRELFLLNTSAGRHCRNRSGRKRLFPKKKHSA